MQAVTNTSHPVASILQVMAELHTGGMKVVIIACSRKEDDPQPSCDNSTWLNYVWQSFVVCGQLMGSSSCY
jgi:hypothetical protein